MFNDIKVALFDVDGTIIDSMPIWYECTTNFLISKNIDVPDNLMKTISTMSFNNAIAYLKEKFNLYESIEEIKKQVDENVINKYTYEVSAKKSIKEFIDYLKSLNIKCYVLTAGLRKYFMPCFNRLGLVEYFDDIWTSEDFKLNKNDELIYKEISRQIKFKPSDIIFFDDSIRALRAAKLAGLHVVGVFDENSKDDKENILNFADGYINNFEELM